MCMTSPREILYTIKVFDCFPQQYLNNANQIFFSKYINEFQGNTKEEKQ